MKNIFSVDFEIRDYKTMKRIILIDDHSIVRIGIRTLLETHPDFQVVAEADSRKSALEALKRERPELAIVDLILGSDDGIDFIKECRTRYNGLKILVITMQDEGVYAERVIRAGAKGFVPKEIAADKLLEAVETVLSGELYLTRASGSRILGRILQDEIPEKNSPVQTLSDRELHVFQMVGTGMKTKEIAESLGLSGKTIETYREKIKSKLKLKNAKALLEAARRWVNTGKI